MSWLSTLFGFNKDEEKLRELQSVMQTLPEDHYFRGDQVIAFSVDTSSDKTAVIYNVKLMSGMVLKAVKIIIGSVASKYALRSVEVCSDCPWDPSEAKTATFFPLSFFTHETSRGALSDALNVVDPERLWMAEDDTDASESLEELPC